MQLARCLLNAGCMQLRNIIVACTLIGCSSVERSTEPDSGHGCESCSTRGAVLVAGRSALTDTVPLTDVWSWDGTAWSELASVGPPGLPQCLGRSGDQLYTVAYIGQPPSHTATQQLLGWTGATWTQLSETLPTMSDFASGSLGTWNCTGATTPPITPDAVLARFGDQIVMVGGTPAQTWTWNGAAWTQLAIVGPPPRAYPSMIALGDKLVLFGGEVSDGVLLDDTWTFDGTAWTQLTTAVAPSPRMSASIAVVNDTLVLFGGWNPNNVTLGDTWTWNGTAWTQRDVAGPSPRAESMMLATAVDPAE